MVWERVLGQVVQVALVGALLLPGSWRWVGLAAVCSWHWPVGGAALSTLAVAGHLPVFLVAAESVGVELSPLQLLPIGALVLLGAAIPMNVAGGVRVRAWRPGRSRPSARPRRSG